jgi:hypothetical protein
MPPTPFRPGLAQLNHPVEACPSLHTDSRHSIARTVPMSSVIYDYVGITQAH